ncbi:MAG TPA: cation:proton antiporter [Candidatus Dormibacteraeota bacterium]|jgi:CPA1 family monovalent cation:H+ antiporter|nr:cation:proton antiporter [Candidatus Dormibacteraeota bacterium]
MPDVQIVLGLLVAVVVLAMIARRLRLPYPIVMVIGGLALAVIPGVPRVELAPGIVFLVFLPPLLFKTAWSTSIRDFRANFRSISLLAFGLVLTTTVGVAAIAHAVIPGLPWPTAFILGAVVSPTDAVAATAIMQRLGAPRAVVAIVEGESLVNDASGLVVYRLAVVAATTGGVALWQAGPLFLLTVIGGVAVGLLIGWLMAQIHLRLEDPLIEITLSFLAPYAAYLVAEGVEVSAPLADLARILHIAGADRIAATNLDASGVLAVVVAGLYVGWRSPELLSPNTRVQGIAVWDMSEFIFNGLAFILIGLQLPLILSGLRGRPIGDLLVYAVLICLAVVVIRVLWTFPGAYLPFLFRRVRRRERLPPWRSVTLTSWAGMSGAVSLAAALSVPVAVSGGPYFGGRDLILFLVFGVILFTLVVKGMTLPVLTRALGLAGGDGGDLHEEKIARFKIIAAAERRLDEMVELDGEDWIEGSHVGWIRGHFAKQRRLVETRFGVVVNGSGPGSMVRADEEVTAAHRVKHEHIRRLRIELTTAERAELVRLRNQGAISDGVMHRIEHDLDLEDLLLAQAPI